MLDCHVWSLKWLGFVFICALNRCDGNKKKTSENIRICAYFDFLDDKNMCAV